MYTAVQMYRVTTMNVSILPLLSMKPQIKRKRCWWAIKENDPSFYPFIAVGNNLEKIRNHIETYDLNRYRVSSVFSGLSWAARESHSRSRILQIDVQYFCTEWEPEVQSSLGSKRDRTWRGVVFFSEICCPTLSCFWNELCIHEKRKRNVGMNDVSENVRERERKSK